MAALLSLAVAAWVLAGAGRAEIRSTVQTRPAAVEPGEDGGESSLSGVETRDQMLGASPTWMRTDRPADPGALERLRAITQDWHLQVVYGHWCSDSAREIPRLLAVLDGLGEKGPQVRWVAVDRQKQHPAAVIRELAIERVPTLVISRGGSELGRIVERAEPSIELLLLEILEGSDKRERGAPVPATRPRSAPARPEVEPAPRKPPGDDR